MEERKETLELVQPAKPPAAINNGDAAIAVTEPEVQTVYQQLIRPGAHEADQPANALATLVDYYTVEYNAKWIDYVRGGLALPVATVITSLLVAPLIHDLTKENLPLEIFLQIAGCVTSFVISAVLTYKSLKGLSYDLERHVRDAIGNHTISQKVRENIVAALVSAVVAAPFAAATRRGLGYQIGVEAAMTIVLLDPVKKMISGQWHWLKDYLYFNSQHKSWVTIRDALTHFFSELSYNQTNLNKIHPAISPTHYQVRDLELLKAYTEVGAGISKKQPLTLAQLIGKRVIPGTVGGLVATAASIGLIASLHCELKRRLKFNDTGNYISTALISAVFLDFVVFHGAKGAINLVSAVLDKKPLAYRLYPKTTLALSAAAIPFAVGSYAALCEIVMGNRMFKEGGQFEDQRSIACWLTMTTGALCVFLALLDLIMKGIEFGALRLANDDISERAEFGFIMEKLINEIHEMSPIEAYKAISMLSEEAKARLIKLDYGISVDDVLSKIATPGSNDPLIPGAHRLSGYDDERSKLLATGYGTSKKERLKSPDQVIASSRQIQDPVHEIGSEGSWKRYVPSVSWASIAKSCKACCSWGSRSSSTLDNAADEHAFETLMPASK